MLIPIDHLWRKYNINPPAVLHLGANTGQEADTYAMLEIPRVIWIEALPELINELRRNIGHYPGHTAICACLSSVDGQEVTFNIASNGLSSSFLEFGTHAHEHPEVKFTRQIRLTTARLDTLIRNHRIEIPHDSFLNIDLQGAELHALRGMGDLLHQFRYAYIEVNEQELYKGCGRVHEVDSHLEQYRLIASEMKMTEHGWGEKFYLRPGVS